MTAKPEITVQRPAEDTLLVILSGRWQLAETIPSWQEVQKQIESITGVRRVLFNTEALAGWDSGLLISLTKVIGMLAGRGIAVDMGGLPEGVQKLLDLASSERQRKGVTKEAARESFFVRVADAVLAYVDSSKEIFALIGETFLGLVKIPSGRVNFHRTGLFRIIQETGAQSLSIVSLISAMVGLIFAFVGAIQLKLFGAQIYVADVVGVGMVRVMGAIMTGIIMSGRTGAAFAAHIGTMQVNEEIDALKTLGISPVEFLVLPRVIALALMVPLLCLYADFMGILGGLFVGVTMLDIKPMEYYYQTKAALTLTHLWVGLFHSFVFGILVSLSGCLRGMQCGRSASEVGYATTSAVVTSIVSIIVATAIITFGCEVLGI